MSRKWVFDKGEGALLWPELQKDLRPLDVSLASHQLKPPRRKLQ